MLRERFGNYPDGTCAPGSTLRSPIFPGQIPCVSPEGVGLYHVCPSGSTPYSITTEDRVTAAICVPTSTAVYPRTTVNPAVFPCNTGDYLGFSATGMKCIPAGSSATTSSSGSGGESLNELSSRLTALRSQYTDLANRATTTPSQVQTLLPQIQTVNQQIAAVLDQMLSQMQYAQRGPNSDTYRTQLVEQLTRIQSDYNGLKTNTDALQTLRRIRSFQDTSWQSTLFIYLVGFLVVALLLVLVMLFRRQKSVSPIAPTMSPTATPPLM
jgi:hypothetical protein